jgi:TolB-like protein
MKRYILWCTVALLSGLPLAATPGKPTLAVLELDAINIKKSDAAALTEKLRYEMFGSGTYVLLERAEMESILKEQGFQQSGCVSSACAVQAGQLLGVKYMLTGSVSLVGSVFMVSLRILDVSTSEIVKNVETQRNGGMEDVLTTGIHNAVAQLCGSSSAEVPADPAPKWVRHGMEWGLENSKGIAIVLPKYSQVWPFAEGLAAVKRSGAWGYVNLKGEEIVAPQYSKVRPFAEGLAAVRRSGMWGYLNTRGEEAVVPQFMQAGDFKNGTARVCTGNPYHAFIIDRTGNKVRDVPLGGK